MLYYIYFGEGCQWRSLPHDFPPWSTVRNYFDKWKKKKVWKNLNRVFREKLRILESREGQPSAAMIDSQSVKTTEKRGRFMALMEEKKLKDENDISW